MKKITFIMPFEGDFHLLTDIAPKDRYKLYYLNPHTVEQKAATLDKTGMFIWVHDVTGGRLAPDQLESGIYDAQFSLERNINGLIVLFAEGDKSYNLPMTAVAQLKLNEAYNNNEFIRTTHAKVGMKKIADHDRTRLWTVIEQWLNEIPQDMLQNKSSVKPKLQAAPAPSAKAVSSHSADQLTIQAQQQKIDNLEAQVRTLTGQVGSLTGQVGSLTERLVTIESRLQIQPPKPATSAQPPSSSFFSNIFGK